MTRGTALLFAGASHPNKIPHLPAPHAELYDQPPAWLAYAAAKQAGGDLAGAELAAQSAAEPGACTAVGDARLSRAEFLMSLLEWSVGAS